MSNTRDRGAGGARTRWEPRGLVGMAVMCIVLVAVTSMLMGVVGYFIRKMMGAE